MSLLKCPDCGKEVSDEAFLCPNCGYPVKQMKKKMKKNKSKKDIKVGNKMDKKDYRIIIIVLSIIIFVIILFILYKFIFVSVMLDNVKKSVVKIEVYDKNSELIATGSGVCAYEENWIITNFHVIDGAYDIKIITDNKEEYNVNDILIFNHENDLAILEFDGLLRPVKINHNVKYKIGKKVIAIGSPMGELNTVSEGIISSSDFDKGVQISAAISHGSSGGALFDTNYNLIGITYAGYENGQNLNYAISIDYLEKLKKHYESSDYFEITPAIKDYCLDETGEDLKFNGCTNENTYYRPYDLSVFFDISDDIEIFKYHLKDSFGIKYDNNLLEKSYQYYFEILSENYCEKGECSISEVSNWRTGEFLLNFYILDKFELSYVLADLDVCDSNRTCLYNKINNYNMGVGEKALIDLLIVGTPISEMGYQNNEAILDLLYERCYKNLDRYSKVVTALGYNIKYNANGSISVIF